ncbi:hypothetical protein [Brevundimonas sp.]|uniref:hypothetical protein n=1 Tax=Brevundimonas sp. TaxID=1871086 RepID=UPI003D110C36
MLSTPLIFASALAFQASAQTPPVTTAPSPQTGATQQQPAPPRARRICEQRAPTGRRLEQRICYTPEQYAALVEAKRKEAQELQGGNNVQNDRGIVGIPNPN